MRGKILAVGGDSHSDAVSTNGSVTYGHNLPERTWPTLLTARLTELTGEPWRENNVAKGGAASDHMAQFADDIYYVGRPEITILYSGANDIGAPLTTAESAELMQATAMMGLYECMGQAIPDAQGYWTNTGQGPPYNYVAGVSNLPANGRAGQRYVVLSDNDSTGGVAAPTNDPTLHTTITGAGSGMAVWECRNARAGKYGYGRVAKPGVTKPWACKKVLIASSPYLNFTSGGDTPTVEKSTLKEMRHAIQAIPASLNVNISGKPTVISINLYALAKARIDAGLDPDFSSVSYDDALSWHCSTESESVISPNQHYNHYGHELHCQWFLDAIVNAKWVT
jgi:hypothetical protein